jgi:small subunit ribosomal protein S1
VVKGKVSRIATFGAFVELGDNIEGLCHNTEIEERKRRDEGASNFRPSTGPLKSAGPLEPNKEYEFKIIKISPESRRIGLSYRAAVKQQERKEIDQYRGSKSSSTATIGDVMKQKLASR